MASGRLIGLAAAAVAGFALAAGGPARAEGLGLCAPDCAPDAEGLSLFTPRSAFLGGGPLDGGLAVPLGELFGAPAAFTISPATPGEPGRGVGAGVSLLGVELGGRYLFADGADPDGLALGGAYAIGALTLGAGVTLPLAETEDAASTNLEVRYRAAPGLTVGGSVALSESGASDVAPDGAVSAGVSLRLDF